MRNVNPAGQGRSRKRNQVTALYMGYLLVYKVKQTVIVAVWPALKAPTLPVQTPTRDRCQNSRTLRYVQGISSSFLCASVFCLHCMESAQRR